MALEIKWSKRADQKFDKIIDYLSTEWGNHTTKTFVQKVYDFLDLLLFYPEIGSIENEERGIRGFSVSKQINIFYRLKNNTIIILDLFDNRQSQTRKKF
jgi:plasmid stabilization system protein ParE